MLVEGKQSFFMVRGKVSMGTVYKCDCCEAWAATNTVTIGKGPNYDKAASIARVNGEVNKELFYNETKGDVCQDCDN